MEYSRQELIGEKLDKVNDISQFHESPFVNYRSCTTDTDELYTEVIAEWVIEHLDDFLNIKARRRGSSYYTAAHNGITERTESNRKEKRITMACSDKACFLSSVIYLIIRRR